MNFEPEKFFIGLTDFFAILLPGALLTYFLRENAWLAKLVLGEGYTRLPSNEGWIAFFFGSYLLGHFIFLLGSWLLDDKVYDTIRQATYDQQVSRLASGKSASSPSAMWLAAHFIKSVSDHALRQAVRIKERYLDPLDASPAINAFQWCKARLNLEHPQALAKVERFEADSKFFRSLVILLCGCFVVGLALFTLALRSWMTHHDGMFNWHGACIALISVALLPFAFWRYVDQRVKATNQAYWYAITLEASRGVPYPSQPEAGGASHAGGVVCKQAGRQTQYLLVAAKNAPHEWVLPKGHIERGERMQETAVREVQEEAGVWARILQPLDAAQYTVAQESVKVQFYLMEAVREGKACDRRAHAWMPLDEALQRASHPETKELLRLADQRRNPS